MRSDFSGLACTLILLFAAAASEAGELLYANEGNRDRRIDLDTVGSPTPLNDVWKDRASAGGRDLNGQICMLRDGTGRIVMGEDSGQPTPPAGWGVFDRDGEQVGKLTPTFQPASPEPFGCALDDQGRLFTSDIGNQVSGACNGQLTMWFPPFDHFPGPPGAFPNTNEPSTNFCKLATNLCTAGTVAVDGQGRVLVTQTRPGGGGVLRFSGPLPTSPDAAGGCGAADPTGAPMADSVAVESFIDDPMNSATPSGLARSPAGGWYLASVLTGTISEYDVDGNYLRRILQPPAGETGFDLSTGHPQGIAVAENGDVYFADLQLVLSGSNIGPGPDGKLRRVPIDAAGNPGPPEILLSGLAFPDGVSVLPGDLEPHEWRTYAGGPERQFFNPAEVAIKAANIGLLEEKWSFTTGAIVTASPVVARVDVPGEGLIPVVYFQSWDGFVYAVRLSDGSELWSFETTLQPGASFPNVASAHVENVGGQERLFIGAGQTMYALDAVTGAEIWRFEAGTGCVVPGACDFNAERNEIEASAVVADGKVFFGMDVNDVEGGKGGFYAVDVDDGRLEWFFDLESGETCTPLPGDNIRRYDGYHSESELGLPAGFFTTRPGCAPDRTGTGCGNVWSSPALDTSRGLLYFGSSNCDTDNNPATLRPPPPMPPYDEAVVALDYDGNPAWRWRPREVDNDDLAYGGVPNLFTIAVDGVPTEVLGIGNKDGSYTVLDRDGVNESSGVSWDDADPSSLPYWSTQVVPGGALGGVVATAAVDEASGRVYFGTAPGFDPLDPQRPTMHALDANTGAVLWQNTGEANADATFSPASAVPGLAFTGAVVSGTLRPYDAASGDRLGSLSTAGIAVASGAAVVDGLLIVGSGIGTRNGNPASPSEVTSRLPSPVTAFGLLDCGNGVVESAETCDDGGILNGDGCSDACEVESGFECTAEPSVCVALVALTDDQQRCVRETNGVAADLGRTQNRLSGDCAKRAAKGRVASAQTCLEGDPKGGIARRGQKLVTLEQNVCVDAPDPAPPYGYSGPAATESALLETSRAIAADLFGSPADPALVSRAQDSRGAGCQIALLRKATSLYNGLWKEARKSQKLALRGDQRFLGSGPVETARQLGDETIAAWNADAGGQIARRSDALAKRVEKLCGRSGILTPLDQLVPGGCDATSTASIAACGQSVARCQACEAVRRTGEVEMDCDRFDDGALNETCP